jgi:hypothetical protein
MNGDMNNEGSEGRDSNRAAVIELRHNWKWTYHQISWVDKMQDST